MDDHYPSVTNPSAKDRLEPSRLGWFARVLVLARRCAAPHRKREAYGRVERRYERLAQPCELGSDLGKGGR